MLGYTSTKWLTGCTNAIFDLPKPSTKVSSIVRTLIGWLRTGPRATITEVSRIPLISSGDAAEIRQDIQDLFDDLASSLSSGERGGAGECHPSVDVLETDAAVEIFVDVAGISARALRVAFRGDVLVIVGEKAPSRPAGPRTFHLVEREFGRFARAGRLQGAFDITAARAEIREGELHIVLPKLEERRGRTHQIQIDAEDRLNG